MTPPCMLTLPTRPMCDVGWSQKQGGQGWGQKLGTPETFLPSLPSFHAS